MSAHPNGPLTFFLSVSYRKQKNEFHPSHVRLRKVKHKTLLLKTERNHPLYKVLKPVFKSSAKPAAQGDSSDLDYTVDWTHSKSRKTSLLSRGLGYRIEMQSNNKGFKRPQCTIKLLVGACKSPTDPMLVPSVSASDVLGEYLQTFPDGGSIAVEVAYDGIRVFENEALVLHCAHFNKLLDPDSINHRLVQLLIQSKGLEIYDLMSPSTDPATTKFEKSFRVRGDYILCLVDLLLNDSQLQTDAMLKSKLRTALSEEIKAIDVLYVQPLISAEKAQLRVKQRRRPQKSMLDVKKFLDNDPTITPEQVLSSIESLVDDLKLGFHNKSTASSVRETIQKNIDDLDLATHLYRDRLRFFAHESLFGGNFDYALENCAWIKKEDDQTEKKILQTANFQFFLDRGSLSFARVGAPKDSFTHMFLRTNLSEEGIEGSMSGQPFEDDSVLITVKNRHSENRVIFDLNEAEKIHGPENIQQEDPMLQNLIQKNRLPELVYELGKAPDDWLYSMYKTTAMAVLCSVNDFESSIHLWLYYLPNLRKPDSKWHSFDVLTLIKPKLQSTHTLKYFETTWMLAANPKGQILVGCKISSADSDCEEYSYYIYLSSICFDEQQENFQVKSETLVDAQQFSRFIVEKKSVICQCPVLSLWTEVRGKYFSILCERDASLIICHCYWHNRFVLIGRQNRNVRGIYIVRQLNETYRLVDIKHHSLGKTGVVKIADTGKTTAAGLRVYRSCRLQPSF